MSALIFFLVFAGFILLMEIVAWITHKYVMHGWLWSLHRSHHEPREGAFEKNDWFAVLFAVPSMILMYFGVHGYPLAMAAGLGILGYGLIYFFFHDILVHRRIDFGLRPKKGYLARIVQAHRLHHAVESKDGCVSFGFIFPPSPKHLKTLLKAKEAAVLRAPDSESFSAHAP
ncbi:sterol desaturase family protein [Hyphococcus flavus]|uniref:Sterol desaturase family protein n=1 Tax=Hyphococcus flavus TaxID=1866326 RepID=A0AAE9ZBE2_9PROT|nr:sterol desaturase family protein [Hyphococcus flavus]WDI31489.1 sterol desaturase family protein [Hyphococcus flavus]